MKTLINNIVTFLKSDITLGDINVDGIKAANVSKGISGEESILMKPNKEYPYIMVDDGGEGTEETDAANTMWRNYFVVIQFAVFETNIENTIDNILDLSAQIEASVKAQKNRQSAAGTEDGYDDLIWGIKIDPFAWDDDRFFYRGRTVTVQWRKLESTYFRF